MYQSLTHPVSCGVPVASNPQFDVPISTAEPQGYQGAVGTLPARTPRLLRKPFGWRQRQRGSTLLLSLCCTRVLQAWRCAVRAER